MTGTWFEQTRDYSPTIETIDVLHQIWKTYGQWCKRRFFKNWQEQNVNFGWIFPDFLFFLDYEYRKYFKWVALHSNFLYWKRLIHGRHLTCKYLLMMLFYSETKKIKYFLDPPPLKKRRSDTFGCEHGYTYMCLSIPDFY